MCRCARPCLSHVAPQASHSIRVLDPCESEQVQAAQPSAPGCNAVLRSDGARLALGALICRDAKEANVQQTARLSKCEETWLVFCDNRRRVAMAHLDLERDSLFVALRTLFAPRHLVSEACRSNRLRWAGNMRNKC